MAGFGRNLFPRPAGYRSAADIAHRANRPPEHHDFANPARGDRRALDPAQPMIARALAIADQFADRQRAGLPPARTRQRHPLGLDAPPARHRTVAAPRPLQPPGPPLPPRPPSRTPTHPPT